MALVHEARTFVADARATMAWLQENRHEDQVDSFLLALRILRARIARYPEAGAILRQDGAVIVRVRLFPRPLPYLVHYSHAATRPVNEVFLLRIFGAGQRRSADVR